MITNVYKALRASQYTGNNAAVVAADVNLPYTEEPGVSMTVGGLTATPGQWYVWGYSDGPNGIEIAFEEAPLPDAVYTTRYQRAASKLLAATGSQNVAANLLGGQRTLNVDISVDLGTMNYIPQPRLEADTPALLGGHAIKSCTVLDADTVRVVLVSAIAAGAVRVVVSAYALGLT